jgi:hypothetical protein
VADERGADRSHAKSREQREATHAQWGALEDEMNRLGSIAHRSLCDALAAKRVKERAKARIAAFEQASASHARAA